MTDNQPELIEQEDPTRRGIIAWFARNTVAANLLMVFILLGGLISAITMKQQMFPEIEIDWLQVQVYYPGAAPKEVEEGITLKVEEALKSLQGLERVITYSRRGMSQAYIKVAKGFDPQEVLDEVKGQVDSISSFPAGIERPRIERFKYRQEVMYLSLYGDLSPTQLKDLGRKIHEEIQSLPSVSVSEYFSGLGYEIGVEVSKDRLREYNLTFQDIAQAIRNYSSNMSAGQIKAADGYISLRVENQAYRGYQFEQIPLVNLRDGTQVKLGDVATISDGFEDGIQYQKFNGKNSVAFFIGATRDQNIMSVAQVVKNYVEKKEAQLPDGVHLETWVDMTYYLQGRLDMMKSNMWMGAALVFFLLAIFLRVRLAFWVMLGLPISFLGAFMFMPLEWVNISINIASLFGFILVLGVVVDDAIVIGESAYNEIEEKGQSVENVIRGAQKVAMPATFGVLTTVAAFFPMLLADGPSKGFSIAIGGVVILCLLFSLVESKLILPAHLAHMKQRPHNPKNPFHWLRQHVDGGLRHFVENIYRPKLQSLLNYRWAVLASFLAVLLISFGFFGSGLIRFIGTPKVPSDFPDINIEMQITASEQATLDAALAVENMIYEVDKQLEAEFGQKMIRSLNVELRSRTSARIMSMLVDPEVRPVDTFELAARWREAMPPLPGVKTLTIQDSLFGNDRDDGDISFRLESTNQEELYLAVQDLRDKLSTLKGVGDINDSRRQQTHEVQFQLKPLAYSMGLTLADVARQVGYGFYGIEAQRILRNGEEIKVMVRYPEHQRNGVALVEDTVIRAPNGAEVPLSEVADFTMVMAPAEIRRENSKRSINVWASVDAQQAEPQKIAQDIRDNFLPAMLKNYPSVKSSISGRIQEEMDDQAKQMRNFLLSMIVVYALLAIPLRSYTQPMMIMSVIPFGIIGSMIGHMIMGMDMSAMSVFGLIAVAGVVVNDSLVMVDYVNNARREGSPLIQAVVDAGCRRFRAIILTSLTTFIGVVPILLETSMQAKIVIPMAVSLAFGVLFATVITLLMIPCLYVAGNDIRGLFRRKQPSQDVAASPQSV
ncbi:efflux RND transporter permease subunit [Simiduia agarivorans]|uniref:Acriflavin resistance protein n=1 Tax=Simiduia agarivorans (strain DSM 21679 / JCM 13881 / BCRC 17597 / SA1) TaxID=1117647 RepID=K4KGZ1_SIMAS|nr:efflux RND transporter permease subunit [Simiduia agarivorans]AFU98374.1 acriflavin resistance protein [Simiduia agarivorans SA1 = DSM 21679]